MIKKKLNKLALRVTKSKNKTKKWTESPFLLIIDNIWNFDKNLRTFFAGPMRCQSVDIVKVHVDPDLISGSTTLKSEKLTVCMTVNNLVCYFQECWRIQYCMSELQWKKPWFFMLHFFISVRKSAKDRFGSTLLSQMNSWNAPGGHTAFLSLVAR